jgi:predicted dehydrogenase
MLGRLALAQGRGDDAPPLLRDAITLHTRAGRSSDAVDDSFALAFAELRTDFWAMDVEDNAYLALRPACGGLAWLHASWTEWKNLFSFEIALERAKIEIRGLGGSYGTESLRRYEMTPEMGPPVTRGWEYPQRDESWERELLDCVAELEGTPGIGARIDDGVAALSIVEEAYAQ